MPKKSLLDIFEIERKTNKLDDIADYEVFTDKEELDSLRTRIIENIIDKELPKNIPLADFINEEIDRLTSGYSLSTVERNHIFNLIDNEINGSGPITELLEDKNVTEIMVNSPKEIYIETDGKLTLDKSISFINNDHILRTIRRLIEPLGKTIDVSHPIVDVRLSNGSRLNAIIPPLTNNPIFTIKKFKDDLKNIEDLVRSGSLTPYMATFLEAAVKGGLNIIIAGSSNSGKTTLLNILGDFISDDERIITIEDTKELNLSKDHVISLEARLSVNKEEEVTTEDLIINSLKMRPDRIILGELKGKEAFDLMQAINTGFKGTITSLHAKSVSEAIKRLETMALMGSDMEHFAIVEYIASAFDLVILTERLSDGKIRVVSICEIDKVSSDSVDLKEIFTFKQKNIRETGEVDGEYILKVGPFKTYKKLKTLGFNELDEIFKKK